MTDKELDQLHTILRQNPDRMYTIHTAAVAVRGNTKPTPAGVTVTVPEIIPELAKTGEGPRVFYLPASEIIAADWIPE